MMIFLSLDSKNQLADIETKRWQHNWIRRLQIKEWRGQYLIFVRGTRGGARGENCHLEKFVHVTVDRLSGREIFHMRNVKKSEMWRNNVYNFWCFVKFYNILLQNHSFAIYADLSRNLLWYDLRGVKLSQTLGPRRKITKMRLLPSSWYETHISPLTFKQKLSS